MSDLGFLWVYLATSPLLWLTATLLSYVLADRVAASLGRHPLANPLLIAIVLMVGVLLATKTPFATYFEGAQFVHFLLGPATVALAVPLWHNRWQVVRALLPLLAALLVGSLTAIVSAVGIAWAFGAPGPVLAAIAPKSVTTAIAMSVAQGLGGDPALTAMLVIATGIVGGMMWPLLGRLGVRDPAAQGFATGLAAHGMGTARAFQADPVAGSFAGIALALNGLMTSLIVPVVLRLFGM
ncbi:LrgB family protein [Rhodovastum atsumiense]|uniref:LrgB family protein n=1 Tax=Rhodovastum atsumiense TaxID=504468 RepID=A0A5M6IQA5_9PROT|nr:LrgB family protein [Rhodovastum atsumiense]KAA5610109.1 LrgB family protein [Rhodovastum atsumiense]CAH2601419.1 LrgB family protein [Rhodovastum atsumiense]